MFTTAGGDHPGFLTATEALEDHGPFVLIHQGTPPATSNTSPQTGIRGTSGSRRSR